MKINQTKILSLAIFLLCLAAACNTGSGNTSAGKTNQSKDSAPPVELRAEALTKEWLANPAATDEKYAGKKLAIEGETDNVEISGDNAVIQLNGSGAKVFCNTEATDGTDKLKKMLNDSRIPKPIKMTVKGVYVKGSTDKSAVEIKPCEPPYLFQ